MGDVYEAYDPVLERTVAMKVLRPRPSADSDAGVAGELARDAIYLLRPDGYVGGAFSGASSATALARYLEAHGIGGK